MSDFEHQEMEVGVINYFDWVDSSVVNDIEADFKTTFSKSEKSSKLEFRRFHSLEGESNKVGAEFGLFPEQISTASEIEHFSKLPDPCQVFYIGQTRSYSRLHIARGVFEQLLEAYVVFDRIWDFILPFSFKTRESDIGHAPFRFRQSEPVLLNSGIKLGSFECAYGFRYVELNHRQEANKENPDYDPWSVRQTAVYQQYDSTMDRVTFFLVAPSKSASRHLEMAVSRSINNENSVNAFDLHRIIISTLHENWRLYIRSLERLLMVQSDRVTLTQVRSETERLSPLEDFAINFIDRQRIKKIEDKVLDLVVVFESLHNTLSELQRQCRIHCVADLCKNCTCSRTVEELGEQMHEVQVNLKKTEVLHRRAQGTAHLLSDLLDYENAQIAHLNEKSLNGLAQETKEENSKMRILTERSARDAAAVKILTVITLIYLPMTVVLNFFSTQLIHVDENGTISVISQSWWFVVVAVPLTIVTFMVWNLWLSYVMKRQEPKESPGVDGRHPSIDLGVKGTFKWLPRRPLPAQPQFNSGIFERPPRRIYASDLESMPIGPLTSCSVRDRDCQKGG